MFGRKETERRSLEDMFNPIDEVVASVDDEKTACDLEECQKVGNVGNAEKKSCVPIKPLDCFGMEEEKTEKWLGKCVKFWFCLMSFMWFLFGALTFAPVIFISNKVNVIFNDKKKSLICATLIHGLLLSLITIFVFVK